MTAAGNRLFFHAGSPDQVWTSDGTEAGTRALTSFTSVNAFGSAEWLLPAGNGVYFLADDGVHGRQIWRADGARAWPLTNLINVAIEFADQPTCLAVIGDSVLFEAFTSGESLNLWVSHGTPATTTKLPLACNDCSFDVFQPVVASAGRGYYVLHAGFRTELWATDGTVAGTRHLRDLPYSDVRDLQPWSDGVLFVDSDYEQGQIWQSDGTTSGTLQLTHLVDEEPIDRAWTTGLDGKLYLLAEELQFGGTSGLWARDHDGTTHPVMTFEPSGPTSQPFALTTLGDRLFFLAFDGESYEEPDGLWSTGGTPETTSSVPAPVDWQNASGFVASAGLLFFQEGPSYGPQNLWRTDGTSAGTFVAAHLQGTAVTVPYQGALYFFDGGWVSRTDGSSAGPVKTGDLPADLRAVDAAIAGPNGIYLKGVGATGTEFWFTNGTTAGTRQLTHLDVGGSIEGDPELTALGDHVYFTAPRLWRTDGTAAGTQEVTIPGLDPQELPSHLRAYGGALYFLTSTSVSDHDVRLWRLVDGSTPVEIARFPGSNIVALPVLTPFAGKLYFAVDDGVHGAELWATDGSSAGTALVCDVEPGWRSSRPSELTVAGGRLFFAATDELHGTELWQSDGTAAGTHLVQDIAPQIRSSGPEQLTVAGDRLFFSAHDGVTGRELWSVSAGGSSVCRPSSTRLCLGGGRYAVEATWRDFDGNTGVGHAASLTSDTGYFWFFSPSNVEAVLKVLDGRGVNDHVWVYYGALSNVKYTLTVTDTETGVSRRYVNPEGQLASVGDTHAFGPSGATLKATEQVATSSPLPLITRGATAVGGTCVPSATRLCLDDGRFAVEVAWRDFDGNSGSGQAVTLTRDTGWFWFFAASNVEVMLKVLDGRAVNDHFWVFYGALSNVQYEVTVTDTTTGAVRTYTNPAHGLASVADVDAF